MKSRLEITEEKISELENRNRNYPKWNDIIDSMEVSLSKFRERVKNREAWCAAVHGVAKSRTRLSNWTTKYETPRKKLGKKLSVTLGKLQMAQHTWNWRLPRTEGRKDRKKKKVIMTKTLPKLIENYNPSFQKLNEHQEQKREIYKGHTISKWLNTSDESSTLAETVDWW